MSASCPICKKTMTFAGLRQHIFSGFHAKDVINSIHKRKVLYTTLLEKFTTQPKSCGFPKLYLTQTASESHEFCHPCKKFRTVKNNMPIDCNDDHKKQSMEFIKECLAKEASEPIVEEVEAPKTSDADALQLKKQVVAQQKKIAALESAGEEASDDADAFYAMLSHMNEEDTAVFDQMMAFLKANHPSVHDRQIKNFSLSDE